MSGPVNSSKRAMPTGKRSMAVKYSHWMSAAGCDDGQQGRSRADPQP
jgi:hypothetical protein